MVSTLASGNSVDIHYTFLNHLSSQLDQNDRSAYLCSGIQTNSDSLKNSLQGILEMPEDIEPVFMFSVMDPLIEMVGCLQDETELFK